MLDGYLQLIPRPAAPATVRSVTGAEVPAGHWLHHWHYPRPVTPLYADFEFGSHLFFSEDVAAQEYAAINAGRSDRHARGGRFLIVDGYVFKEQIGHLTPGTAEAIASHVAFAPVPQGVPEDYHWAVLHRWAPRTRPALVDALNRFQAVSLASRSDAGLLDHLSELSDHLTVSWALYFTIDAAAAIVRRKAQDFCTRHLGLLESTFLQLLVGFSPSTSAPVTVLEELASQVATTPSLRAVLETPDPWSDARIQALLGPYLANFGHRATDWEYISATLAERPQRVVQLLKEAVARVEAGQPPLAEMARREREAVVAELRARLPSDESHLDHAIRTDWRAGDRRRRHSFSLSHRLAGVRHPCRVGYAHRYQPDCHRPAA